MKTVFFQFGTLCWMNKASILPVWPFQFGAVSGLVTVRMIGHLQHQLDVLEPAIELDLLLDTLLRTIA